MRRAEAIIGYWPHCVIGRRGTRGPTRNPSKNAPTGSTQGLAECGSLADIWRLELRPLAGQGARLATPSGAAQPCRCKHAGQPACSLGAEIEENSAEAPELGPVVQYCIKPFARTWPRSSRIIMALVRLFRAGGRNHGADALGNAVAPMPDRRFVRGTA